MSRHERYGSRSLTYSRWHRALPDHVTMIDVDGLEYCRRCRAPLAVVETARDVGQAVKPAIVLRSLAKAAGIPAYVFLYTVDEAAELREDWPAAITSFRVKRVHPNETDYQRFDPDEVAKRLAALHEQHHCEPARP